MESTRKRILLVTLEYPPDEGGIARYLEGIVKNVDAEVVVVAHGTKKRNDPSRTHLLFPKFIWPRWGRGIATVVSHLRLLRPEYITISHILPMGYVALLARRIVGSKAKLIVFCHGFDLARPLARSPWKCFWIRFILRRSDMVVANSNYTKSLLLKFDCKEDKIVVVYPGIDATPIERGVLAKSHPILLSLGRLVQRKSFDCMIIALPKILQEVPNLKYIIAGDGPDLQRLKKMAFSVGVDRNVWFTGRVDEARKHKLFSTSHVFAMPSRDIDGDVEGFGTVFLEAARYGMPSIGSHSGGIPEAIEDTLSGVLVDPMSTDEVAHTVITLFNTPDLIDQMGGYARDRASELFVWSKTIVPLNERIKNSL